MREACEEKSACVVMKNKMEHFSRMGFKVSKLMWLSLNLLPWLCLKYIKTLTNLKTMKFSYSA